MLFEEGPEFFNGGISNILHEYRSVTSLLSLEGLDVHSMGGEVTFGFLDHGGLGHCLFHSSRRVRGIQKFVFGHAKAFCYGRVHSVLTHEQRIPVERARGGLGLFLEELLLLEGQLGNCKFIKLVLPFGGCGENVYYSPLEGRAIGLECGSRGVRLLIPNHGKALALAPFIQRNIYLP